MNNNLIPQTSHPLRSISSLHEHKFFDNSSREFKYKNLKEAILQRDRGTIIWLINEGCSVNNELLDGQSDSALHLAIFMNDFHTVKILLSEGAQVNTVNYHKQTPLHLAFEMNNMKMVDLLLFECDGRVNPFTNYGLSHFHIACVRNNWQIVNSFLEHGVNANIYLEKSFYGKDYVYYRPLHLAVKYQNFEVAELLLKYGANVNAKDRYKRNPLHLACSYNKKKICEAIRDPEIKVAEDVVHLIKAETIQIDIVNLLIRYGANVNALDANGMPPLFHVFKYDYEEIKNIIHDKFGTEDPFFWTKALEMFRAIQNEKFYILLQHDVGTKFCNYSKDTLLHLIIDGKKIFGYRNKLSRKDPTLSDEEKAEIVNMLLKYGADVEAKNCCGQTPLQMAISNYNVKTVKVLLNHYGSVRNICFFHYKIPKKGSKGNFDLFNMENFLDILSIILKKKSDLGVNQINELLVLRFIDTEVNIQHLENCNTSDLSQLLDFGDINTMNLSSYVCERTVLSNREKISLILQHIQKLELAGLYVNDIIKKEFLKFHCLIDTKKNGSDLVFADLCRNEIKKMKAVIIDRYASLYDIMFLNINKIAVRMKNRHFIQTIRTSCNSNLIIYKNIIIKQFVKGMVRSVLFDLTKECLSCMIELDFPDPCSEGILSHLTNEDLCNLALAFVK